MSEDKTVRLVLGVILLVAGLGGLGMASMGLMGYYGFGYGMMGMMSYGGFSFFPVISILLAVLGGYLTFKALK